MQNEMPLRWIEEAEARAVLATALFERPDPLPARKRDGSRAAPWLRRLRGWFVAGSSQSLPVLQAQPVLVYLPVARRAVDGDYRGRW